MFAQSGAAGAHKQAVSVTAFNLTVMSAHLCVPKPTPYPLSVTCLLLSILRFVLVRVIGKRQLLVSALDLRGCCSPAQQQA